ncbi:thioesterase family protein [Glycomyces scopariae]|uniref:Acyl-CoA thioester hydrolase n=1 Tax=Glycomyces sambucus TaxID=380244 RepID=A0A1G9I7J4_9ACTN|nr:thioesterase family protein [Glycomyces sambucus]SDL20784.1 acyl-CoA thioester hydrolase [Glycomyces sambucus]
MEQRQGRAEATGGQVHVCERHLGLGDLDWLGHVNNVRMLEMVQDAQVRWCYLEREAGVVAAPCFVYAGHEIQYKRELTLRTAPVRIETRVTRIGRSSLHLASRIRDDEAVYCEVASVAVAIDTERLRPRQLSDGEREYFARFAAAEPALSGV